MLDDHDFTPVECPNFVHSIRCASHSCNTMLIETQQNSCLVIFILFSCTYTQGVRERDVKKWRDVIPFLFAFIYRNLFIVPHFFLLAFESFYPAAVARFIMTDDGNIFANTQNCNSVAPSHRTLFVSSM